MLLAYVVVYFTSNRTCRFHSFKHFSA